MSEASSASIKTTGRGVESVVDCSDHDTIGHTRAKFSSLISFHWFTSDTDFLFIPAAVVVVRLVRPLTQFIELPILHFSYKLV